MVDKERIPGRSIRVPDDLWEATHKAAEWRGDPSVSAVIRKFLHTYVRQTERMVREAGGNPTNGSHAVVLVSLLAHLPWH